jgi:tRNA modification GTPase
MLTDTDTIFAPATPDGFSAVAIIRLSGPQAFNLAEKLFVPYGSRKIHEGPFPAVLVGQLMDGREVLDEIVLLLFRGPRSFTGEDVAEFQCHGSPYVVRRLGQLLSELGARTAEPGEFTRRAFLNGRLSLAQAEAIMDLISAETQAQQRLAISQMRGGYAADLRQLRAQLLELMALVELELDFSEEDVEFASRERLAALLEDIMDKAHRLTASFATGNALRQGVPVAIIGAPNAGKSTLLNALVRDERALVSDIAGTTRDTVEDYLTVGGVKFRLVDTAGLHDTEDPVERMGIERALRALKEARIIVWVHAPDARLSAELSAQVEAAARNGGARIIHVWNKADLTPPDDHCPQPVLAISARSGSGVQELVNRLLTETGADAYTPSYTLTNQRHYEALRKAQAAASRATELLRQKAGTELMAFELRELAHHLGSITGDSVTADEVLGAIFSRFCIGK